MIISADWKGCFHPLEALFPPNGKDASAYWKRGNYHINRKRDVS